MYKDHTLETKDANGQKVTVTPSCYITLGGFDALSVYELVVPNRTKWLEDVLKDRQQIIKKLSATVTYHPVHVIGNNYSFQKNKILFLTFVYGVRDDDDFEEQVKKCLRDADVKEADQTQIYRCINISERVILSHSTNIVGILKGVLSIAQKGYARKVYTTANFPLKKGANDEAEIAFNLENVGPASLEDKFCICMKGSIKNYKRWDEVIDKLNSKFNPQKQTVLLETYYNYGEDDFAVEMSMTLPTLLDLLTFFMDQANVISEACWDIHTELQLKHFNNMSQNQSPCIASVLNKEYEKLLDLSDKIDTLTKYSWYYALLELFPALRNIDSHPLLKGPAYLLYDSLHILNAYLDGYINKDNIPDLKEIDKIFHRSEKYISQFLSCVSRLTDQLIQNDDVIFHGLGQEPAIATTQPEILLEFYHDFLRELADYLIKIDQKYQYIDDNSTYEYGFLISPELNQRVSLTELFWLKRNNYKGTGRKAWPMKQAYIIQLPTEDVFKPLHCFIPLIHECFHRFGDKLRFRDHRFTYMAMFVSATLLAEWGKDVQAHKDMFWEICKQLTVYKDTSNQEEIVNGESFDQEEIYMTQAQNILEMNLARILSTWGVEDLYYKLQKEDKQYIYTVATKRRAEEIRACFVKPHSLEKEDIEVSYHIQDCAYYFNECYADVMAIATFDIRPDEYLAMFEDELRYFERKEPGSFSAKSISQIIGICQRIAVVLATLQKSDLLKSDDIKKALSISDNTESRFNKICLFKDSNVGEQPVEGYRMGKIIETCYNALTETDAEPLQPRNGKCILYGVLPISAMSYLIEYLWNVVKFYTENPEIEKITSDHVNSKNQNETMRAYLKRVFDQVIRNEEFFGEDFKAVILNNRKRIDDLASETQSGNAP